MNEEKLNPKLVKMKGGNKMETIQPDIVESYGKFKLRYGYNSSMDFTDVCFALEAKSIPAKEVSETIAEMARAEIPEDKLANYLADHYKLFGW